jgi:hypothetical protein
MWKAAKGLLQSKKALMAFISAGVWLGGKVGLDLDAETLLPAVAPMWAYIFGQGLSDFGKGAKERELESDNSSETDDGE